MLVGHAVGFSIPRVHGPMEHQISPMSPARSAALGRHRPEQRGSAAQPVLCFGRCVLPLYRPYYPPRRIQLSTSSTDCGRCSPLRTSEGPYLDPADVPLCTTHMCTRKLVPNRHLGNKPVCGGSRRNQRRNEARLVHGGGLAVTAGKGSSTRRRCWHPSEIRASTDYVAQTWWFFLPTRLLRGGGARSIRCRPCP